MGHDTVSVGDKLCMKTNIRFHTVIMNTIGKVLNSATSKLVVNKTLPSVKKALS